MREVSLFIAVLISAASSVMTQISTFSSLSGHVTDQNGAVIQGASLILTNVEINQTFVVTTDEDGVYRFPRIEQECYRLRVEKAGLMPSAKENLSITISEAATANVVPQVSNIAETVVVTARTSVVEAERSSLSLLVDERRMRKLSLNAKNYLRSVQLAPGIGPVASGHPSFNNLPINGSRPSANTYALDGGNFNDERFESLPVRASNFSGSAPNIVSTKANQEFCIITSNADATFGRSSGGDISTSPLVQAATN